MEDLNRIVTKEEVLADLRKYEQNAIASTRVEYGDSFVLYTVEHGEDRFGANSAPCVNIVQRVLSQQAWYPRDEDGRQIRTDHSQTTYRIRFEVKVRIPVNGIDNAIAEARAILPLFSVRYFSTGHYGNVSTYDFDVDRYYSGKNSAVLYTVRNGDGGKLVCKRPVLDAVKMANTWLAANISAGRYYPTRAAALEAIAAEKQRIADAQTARNEAAAAEKQAALEAGVLVVTGEYSVRATSGGNVAMTGPYLTSFAVPASVARDLAAALLAIADKVDGLVTA